MEKENTASPLTTTQQAELAALEERFGTIHIITGKDDKGNEVVTFLKKLSYDTKKKVMLMLMQNQDKTIEAGEMILVDTYAGGDDLYADEDTRLEAALMAFELFKVNDSIQLLKKS